MAALILRKEDLVLTRRPVLDHRFFQDEDLRLIVESYLKFYDRTNQAASVPELLQEVREATRDLEKSERETERQRLRAMVKRLANERLKNPEEYERRLLAFGASELANQAVLDFAEEQDGMNDLDMSEVQKNIARLVGKLEGARTLASKISRPKSYKHSVGARVAYRAAHSTRVIPMGIEALDRLWGGGATLGEIVGIWGDTGRGKTQLMMHAMGTAAIVGETCLLFVGEEQAEAVGTRMDVRFTGATRQELTEDPVAARRRLSKKLKRLKGDVWICEFDISKPFRASDITQVITLVEAETNRPVSVLGIDSPDHMNPDRSVGEKEWEILKRAMRECKPIALGNVGWYRRPRLLYYTSQVNPPEGDGLIGTSQFRGTKEKADIASRVVTINQNQADRDAGRMRLHVPKDRNHAGGKTVSVQVDLSRGVYSDYMSP